MGEESYIFHIFKKFITQLSNMSNVTIDDNLIDERLLEILFEGNEGFANDIECQKYLANITNFPLERLLKEPEELRREGNRTKHQMEDLAFKNYKAFIQSAQCVETIHHEISNVNYHLQYMLETLPKFSTSCKDFTTKAQEISSKRSQLKSTLQLYPVILEILEIPQLMETCVRNGAYEEAMDLEAYTQKLKTNHPNNAIIQEIVEDVKSSTEIMISQLLQQLRTNIQLPTCFRVIGYLKRIGVFEERELRIAFLQCRSYWLHNSIIANIPANNPYSFLTKLTDLSRTHIFDIITQYRAIFPDETTSQDEERHLSMKINSTSVSSSPNFATQTKTEDGGILYGWMNEIIAEYLLYLQKYLGQIKEGVSIANLLDQCMYYGISLGRVGIDFRPLFIPLFENTILSNFSYSISASTNYFILSLSSHISSSSLSISVPPPSNLTSGREQISTSPPVILLEYPLLAILTNGYLTAFNELRHSAPFTLQAKLACCLKENLTIVSNNLYSLFLKLSQKTKNPNSQENTNAEKYVINMCQVFAEWTVPYIIRCFDHLYGQTVGGNKSILDVGEIFAVLESVFKSSNFSSDVSTAIESHNTSDLHNGTINLEDKEP